MIPLSLIIDYLSIKNWTNLDYAVYSLRNQLPYDKALWIKEAAVAGYMCVG